MQHELWIEIYGEQTFCLAGPRGQDARNLLTGTAKLVWTCEANSHLEAMRKYYRQMDWGDYRTDFPEEDQVAYSEMGWEKECDECGSKYYPESSSMSQLCPECAHHLYGHPECDHDFESGRCRKCGWDGSTSDYLKRSDRNTPNK